MMPYQMKPLACGDVTILHASTFKIGSPLF